MRNADQATNTYITYDDDSSGSPVKSESKLSKEEQAFDAVWIGERELEDIYNIKALRLPDSINLKMTKSPYNALLVIEEVPRELKDGVVHNGNDVRYQYKQKYKGYLSEVFFNREDLKKAGVIK
ncbi:hypothetical protein EBB07_22040 [Paenibacillaceae bacterium]|nr:hypothetical protein EBB07_22040 [Paenibacillaceae bacterium]